MADIYALLLTLQIASIIFQLTKIETKLNERLNILEKKIDENSVSLYKEIKICENSNKYEFNDLKDKLGKAFNLMYTEIELLNSNNKGTNSEQSNN